MIYSASKIKANFILFINRLTYTTILRSVKIKQCIINVPIIAETCSVINTNVY